VSITHRAKNLVPVPRVENHCADVAVLTSAAGHALGTALKRECISGTSTMDVSSTTNRPQESGWSSFLLKRPAALLHMDDREIRNEVCEVTLRTRSNKPVGSQRKTVVDAAREYLERSKQKSRKTYIGYRTAVNLFARAAKGRISMRFAGTTRSTTCTFCGTANRQKQAADSASPPCSITSSKSWYS
jgi:hypothetical protein